MISCQQGVQQSVVTRMPAIIYLDSKKYLANFAPLKKGNSLFISRLIYSIDEQGINTFLT